MAIDYNTLFGQANYDPCAVLVQLRPAYMKLLVEGHVQVVKFRDRTVEFGKTDIAQLGTIIAQMESECAGKNGTAPKRSAITAGGRY